MYFNIATRLLCRGIDYGTSYNSRGNPKCGTALETIALEKVRLVRMFRMFRMFRSPNWVDRVLNLYSTVLPGDSIQTATISRWFSLDTKLITALARLCQIVFLGCVPSSTAEEPSQANDSWFWTMWSAMSLSSLHHRRCKARTVSLTSFSSLPAHIGTSKTQQSYWWQKKFPRV